MLEQRVALLSDYAEQYKQKGLKAIDGPGFWQKLTGRSGTGGKRLPIAGLGNEIEYKDLEEEGFAPFCKIDSRIIHVKKAADECWIAISEDETLWDLSDWGIDELFVTQFLAECYFMVTRDDFRIDEDERSVFLSLVGLIEATPAEIVDARVLVYWTLVENVIEDSVITDEEERTMEMIREALEMQSEDVQELHRKSLQDYYDMVVKYSEDEEIDLEKLSKIKEMADKLQVEIEEIS